MLFFDQDYLRVTSVQTKDGVNPRYDENGRIMYKESWLPVSAKKYIERRNEQLPDSLKMKIELVSADSIGAPQNQPLKKPTVLPVRKRMLAGNVPLKKWVSKRG